MVAKKKRKTPAKKSAAVDYKSNYDDLVQRCKRASSQRKKLLKSIAADLGDLSTVICEPDPPGCGGPVPMDSFESLMVSIQSANADKKSRMVKISDKIEKLFRKICDPDPPGC